LFSFCWWSAGCSRTNDVAVFLLLPEPRKPPTGLGSGTAVPEATLRFHLGGLAELGCLLELLGLLAEVPILGVALECWPSASDRSMRVVALPARLLLPDVDLDDVVEMQFPIAIVCGLVSMLRACSDGCDV
jgi:hypothetical protein